ncbi:MAG: PaaI family thioesterase [Desulfurivibrio sp.]|nr:MAG: PaaI family thioesterase [Desulfurivibrio sp.]
MNQLELTEKFKPLPRHTEGFCFGCGPTNKAGLGMRFFSDGDSVVSRVAVPEHLCGWGRVVHGGVISTMLDEVMGWTAIHLLQRLVLTKSLQVQFERPVFSGEMLWLAGRIREKISEREALMTGELFNPAGERCAFSQGVFALFTGPAAKKLGFIDPDLVDMVTTKFFG